MCSSDYKKRKSDQLKTKPPPYELYSPRLWTCSHLLNGPDISSSPVLFIPETSSTEKVLISLNKSNYGSVFPDGLSD
ncbi:MAG TPA: hypothetical protein VIS75_16460, partial [Chitinophagaceae bacterium]